MGITNTGSTSSHTIPDTETLTIQDLYVCSFYPRAFSARQLLSHVYAWLFRISDAYGVKVSNSIRTTI